MSTLVTVRPVDGAIAGLVVDGERWGDPDGAGIDRHVDASRLWCLPGLADAHAHLAQDEMVLEPGEPDAIRRRAFAHLERGVFLCLDKGWSDRSVLTLLDHPEAERPDLQSAGRMIAAPGGYYPGFAVEVGEDGLAGLVAEEARHTAGWVKLVGDWPRRGVGAVANFGEEALRRAVAVAHAGGSRVAIHTMAPGVASSAVAAGVDSIEHGLFLTDADLAALGARQGAWVPTVLRVESVIEEVGRERTGGRLLAEGLERVRSLLPGAARAGVTVLAGSDLAVPVGGIGAEAAALAAAGLAPDEALAAVSTAAYRHAGLEAGFRAGLPADLVGFPADPRQDLSVLLSPALVIRRGRVLLDRR